MPDQLDHAKDIEQAHRQRALSNQLDKARETELPYEEDGVRYCLDCGEAISKERLAARPESVRCIDCKGIQEARGKHYA